MSKNTCNPKKLTDELRNADLPVAGVSSAGRVDYARGLTASEASLAEGIIAAHNPAPMAEELRLKAYGSAGISAEKLVLALWKELKGGDRIETDALQAAMAAIDRSIK